MKECNSKEKANFHAGILDAQIVEVNLYVLKYAFLQFFAVFPDKVQDQ